VGFGYAAPVHALSPTLSPTLSPALLSALCAVASAAAPPPVIGGAPSDAWPAVAVVGFSQGGASQVLCTGTLVEPAWVLTAAHCAADLSVLVDAGLEGTVGFGPTGAEVPRTIEEIVIHPDWDASDFSDDLALLRVAPITELEPVPFSGEDPWGGWVGDGLTAVGFGDADEAGGGAGTKRVLALSVTGVDADFVYLEGSGESNLCSGDSGGPVLRLVDGEAELAGVAAYVYRDDGEQGCAGGAAAAVRGDRAALWVQSVVEGEAWDGIWRSQRPGVGAEASAGCGVTLGIRSPSWAALLGLLGLLGAVGRRRPL
jgi:hypothetical protein